MDPITHAALGASCSQAIFGKYSKHIPWSVGALAAMAPDLDIFIHFQNDPMSLELWHRHFTHSFLFIPLGGLLVALFFLCFSHYRINWKVTLGAALVGYATHGLLDALTSYGTLLLWPMNNSRVSWDIISIVDPLFTIPLILGVLWSVIYQEKKGVMLGLLWATLILSFNSIQHYRALQSMREYGVEQKIHLTDIRAMPNLASSIFWRVIAKDEHCLIINEVHTPILSPSSIVTIAKIPLFANISKLSITSGQQRDLALFSWFTNDYVIVARHDPLTLGDGRYTRGQNPLYSFWGIEFPPQKEHVKKLSSILITERCSVH